jgi:hypothetical protein
MLKVCKIIIKFYSDENQHAHQVPFKESIRPLIVKEILDKEGNTKPIAFIRWYIAYLYFLRHNLKQN